MKTLTFLSAFLLSATCIYSQAPVWQWAKQSVGDGHDYGISIDTDSEGNSYVTGTFQPPSVVIGNDTLTATTTFNSGYYVAKYDPDGNAVWARTISGQATMNSTGISLNSTNDELVVTGYYKSIGYINFGSDSITSGTSFFESYITKYDSAGNSIWTSNGGPSAWNGQINFEVRLDASGNSYMAGTFEDSIYLKKFDPAGTELWFRKFSGNMSNTFFWSLDVNAAGESVVAGYFANTSLVIDTITIALNSNGYTIVLVKSDAQGHVLWAKNDGQVASLYKPDIALDNSGNFYITGYFNGSTCIFDTTTLYNQGVDDIFLVKYNTSGDVQWAQSAGGFHFDQGMGIATDQQNSCYITGLFRSVASFGPHFVFNNGDPEIFVAKYDASGNALWAKQAGGDLVEYGSAIAIDDSTNCYITGCFTSPSPSFDMVTLQNSSPQWNPYDLYIAKLGADNFTGIPEMATPSVIVYPNPLVTESVVFIPGGKGEHTFELYDIRGALLHHSKFYGNQVTIQRENLSPGIYVLRVISTQEVSDILMMVK